MAPLPAPTRRVVMAKLAAALNDAGPLGLTKDDLTAAVSGLDDWLEANAAGANTAIPQPARSALSAPQKAALLSYVALARFGGN